MDMTRKDRGTSGRPDADPRHILNMPVEDLLARARALRDEGHGTLQTFSSKVFIPLTQLCRNYCRYCTFTQPPKPGENCYLSRDEVLAIARAGREAGCTEALFTLGDKPELRFAAARDELERLGHDTTISYLVEMCAAVRDETGLLPHVNAGVMTRDEMAQLRTASASQGLMLETVADRLCERGGPHYRSPDKDPAARLAMLETAGGLAVPFTTGILIGIGETRAERLEAIAAIAEAHARHGHIQEVIVQNFRAKPRTAMANAPEPDRAELMWTIAAARLMLGPEMSIQAPPNLSEADFGELIDAGINDWGGVSPVTPDHVNPERPWPELERLARVTAEHGRTLAPRLPLYPAYLAEGTRWLDAEMVRETLALADASGLARADRWSPGLKLGTPGLPQLAGAADRAITSILREAEAGAPPDERSIVALFAARGGDVERICETADALRRAAMGDTVTYVVNRNINYTNICAYACSFCAFSKGSSRTGLRGPAYDLDHEEVARRVAEAWDRGATEVCLQGGIHPHYTGDTYLALARTVKAAAPGIHLHAFSPLEIDHGAATLGLSLEAFLTELKAAGLDTLPGTAAEILDDEVRDIICPDKLGTARWLEVVETAHRVGLKTTSTIMFGHVDAPRHWARHLLRLRALQERTGGITEFVPLPFVPMEAPMALRGQSRLGPTWRETRLMHAVARIALAGAIDSIQASWCKLGEAGITSLLNAGVNDLGGTLMNESISRAAGTTHGQELPPREMERIIRAAGREPRQRSTLYGTVSQDIAARGRTARPLAPVVQTPPTKSQNRKGVPA